MPLLALMRGVFCIFHLVAELEQGVFDVVEAVWRGFTCPRGADGRHGVGVFVYLRAGLLKMSVRSLSNERRVLRSETSGCGVRELGYVCY